MSNPRYGAWAESVWASTSARVFLKASPAMETTHFAIGLVVLVISFLAVFWINKYAGDIFPGPEAESGGAPAAEVAPSGSGGNGSSTNTGETLAADGSPQVRRGRASQSANREPEPEERELVT